MARMLDGNTEAELAYATEVDQRTRSFEGYEREATAALREQKLDEGMTDEDFDAWLASPAGQDALDDEVTHLEDVAEDLYQEQRGALRDF